MERYEDILSCSCLKLTQALNNQKPRQLYPELENRVMWVENDILRISQDRIAN